MKSPWRLFTTIVLLWVSVGLPVTAVERTQMLRVYNCAPEELAAPVVRTYFTATTANEAEIETFRQRLIEAGARNVNWFFPDVLVCELPKTESARPLVAAPGFAASPEAGAPGSLLSQVQRAYRIADERPEGRTLAAFHEDLDDLVLKVSPEQAREIEREIANAVTRVPSQSEGAPRMFNQNSEIVTGSIKVYLIFPESNGALDAKTETWKTVEGNENQDYLDARTHAFAALLDWQGQFPGMGISYTVVDRLVECDYEPIQHNNTTDGVWILNAIRRLDPDLATIQSPVAAVHLFNEKRRGTHDWIYTAFIGHSRNEPGHRFRGAGYTAYAYLGGPYLVMPYPAGDDPNDIGENLVYSKVYEHEMGHTFWALDEYPGAPGGCADKSGYLWYANMNINMAGPDGIGRCVPEVDCIQNRAAFQDVGRPYCRWSLGHFGVIDANGNAVPDVFEAKPRIEFANAYRETIDTRDFTIELTARSQAVPNRNESWAEADRNQYAAPLREAQFSVGGGWARLAAKDGRWDSMSEVSTLQLSGLSPGPTEVKFRVRNSVGLWSNEHTVIIYSLGVNYASLSVRPRVDANLIAWEVVGDAFGAQFDVYRLGPGEELPDLESFKKGDTMPGTRIATNVAPSGIGSQSAFVAYQYTDRDVTPGVEYRYYVNGTGEVVAESGVRGFQTPSHVVTETAMIPIPGGRIISHASPNPFRGEIKFSLSIPRSGTSAGATGSQSSSLDRSAPTAVAVAVYDVLGRRVKTLYEGNEYADVLTVKWDGTNVRNEAVSSGVYFIRVKAGESRATEKVLLIR